MSFLSDVDAGVDPDTYRDALARFPAGVTVVTTEDDGQPRGLTVSAFSSVSLDPSIVAVNVSRGSRNHEALVEGEAFAVSVLAEDQQEVGTRFADPDVPVEERFDGVGTRQLQTGSPVLEDALVQLDAVVHDTVRAGDHTVVLGRVVAAEVPRPDARPLAYWDRDYRGVVPLERTPAAEVEASAP